MKNLIIVVLGIFALTLNVNAQVYNSYSEILGGKESSSKKESFEILGHGKFFYLETVLSEDKNDNFIWITIHDEGEETPFFSRRITYEELQGIVSWNIGNRTRIYQPDEDNLFILANLTDGNGEPAGVFEITYYKKNLLLEAKNSGGYHYSKIDGKSCMGERINF